MSQPNIDWKRLTASIHQQSKKEFDFNEIRDGIIPVLRELVLHTGEYTFNRPTLSTMGLQILKGNPSVVVPVCPDYSHENGLYTMKSVFNDVSLIAQKHIDFMGLVCRIIPNLRVQFLVADQESQDELLCRKMKLTQSEFLELIVQSRDAIQRQIEPFGWSSHLMTDVFHGLVVEEQKRIDAIWADDSSRRQIEYDTSKREELYAKIDPNLSLEQKLMRTVRTAAQYYCLGEFCLSKDYFVCNHTTTNLAWYLKSGVAVLHNPVSIY